MKKSISILSALLAVIMIVSIALPTVAFASEKEEDKAALEAKSIVAFLYSMSETTTIECLFDAKLPNVPYIDRVDYL